jgi:lycopene cyclase CruA
MGNLSAPPLVSQWVKIGFFLCLGPVLKPLYYREIPCPETAQVLRWLQEHLPLPTGSQKVLTPTGLRLQGSGAELAVFLWSGLNTTYLKIFQWSGRLFPSRAAG